MPNAETHVGKSPLIVLASFRPPKPTTNPYIVMLARQLGSQPELELRCFSWKRALVGRYDVFHIHWPEILISGTPGIKLAGRRLLFCLLLVRLWVTRIAIVRTQHNVRPHHDGRPVENLLLGQLNKLTTWWIALNETAEAPDVGRTTTILHGDYAEWFAGYPQPDTERGQLLFAGLIREYKNVPALIRAFANLKDSSCRLRIVGRPATEKLARSLTDQTGVDDRITTDFRYVNDAELALAVGRCELMVLPYAEMHNSGVALMALSMRRPILTPDNRVTQLLAEEVGPGWVFRFVGDLSAADISAALTNRRKRASGPPPNLARRSWQDAGARHVEVYRAARQLRKRLSR